MECEGASSWAVFVYSLDSPLPRGRERVVLSVGVCGASCVDAHDKTRTSGQDWMAKLVSGGACMTC